MTIVGETEPGAQVRDESQHAGDQLVLDARHAACVAQVVDVGKGSAADYDRAPVAGKIVLADGNVGRVFAEAVQKRGALGVLAYSMPAYTQPESTALDSVRLGRARQREAGVGHAASRTTPSTRFAPRSRSGPVRVRVRTRSPRCFRRTS